MMRKQLFFFLVILFQVSYIFSQENVFTNEVTYVNGFVYSKDKPLTGILYSNDGGKDIPNKCFCTLKASYLKGKLNGDKKEWYESGSKRYIGRYKNGSMIGVHKWFHLNGNLQKITNYENGLITKNLEYFKNGNLLYEKNYMNGEFHGIVKEFDEKGLRIKRVYDHGRVVNEENYSVSGGKEIKVYNDSIEEITDYSPLGKKIRIYSFNRKTNKKEGKWIRFDSIGNKERESVFKRGKKIRFGYYESGVKQGIWKYFSLDGNTEITKMYKDGKVVSLKTIDLSKSIKRNVNKRENLLYSFHDNYTDSIMYYKIVFLFEKPNYKLYKIRSKLLKKLGSRGKRIKNIKSVEKKELSGTIEFSNFSIDYKESLYDRSKKENGKVVNYKVKGFDAFIKYKVRVYNLIKEQLFTQSLTINKSSKLGASFFNNLMGTFSKNESDAFFSTLKHVRLSKLLHKCFPLTGKINYIIKKSKTSVSKIKINIGKKHHVVKKMKFYVFDKNNKRFRSKIQVTGYNDSTSVCKVLTDKKWLKNYILNNKNILIKE